MKKEKKFQNSRPFLEIVQKDGNPFLRVKQATNIGYADCPVNGACDLSYPNSPYRRARTIGGAFGQHNNSKH